MGLTVLLLSACNAPSSAGNSVATVASRAAPTGAPARTASRGADGDNALFPVAQGATWLYDTSGTAGNSTRLDTITDAGSPAHASCGPTDDPTG